MKAVKLYFNNPKYNYTTSVSEQLTSNDIHSYFVGNSFNVASYQEPEIEDFQKCIGFACLVKVDAGFNARLKEVSVFDPRANTRSSALYDPEINCVVSCSIEENYPFYPSCGAQTVIEYGNPCGDCVFVIGCELLAYPVWNCHDNIYRLGLLDEDLNILANGASAL